MRTVLSLLVLVAAFGLVACNDCDSCDDKPEGNAKTTAPTDEAATGAEGTAGETGDAAAEEKECLCVKGLAGDPVWCQKCDKGFIDGEPAHCQGCVKKAQKKLAEATKEAGGAE